MDIQRILNKLGITELNEMQQHAAEAILGSDGDVVLLSPISYPLYRTSPLTPLPKARGT